jgi:hypothetical protein
MRFPADAFTSPAAGPLSARTAWGGKEERQCLC